VAVGRVADHREVLQREANGRQLHNPECVSASVCQKAHRHQQTRQATQNVPHKTCNTAQRNTAQPPQRPPRTRAAICVAVASFFFRSVEDVPGRFMVVNASGRSSRNRLGSGIVASRNKGSTPCQSHPVVSRGGCAPLSFHYDTTCPPTLNASVNLSIVPSSVLTWRRTFLSVVCEDAVPQTPHTAAGPTHQVLHLRAPARRNTPRCLVWFATHLQSQPARRMRKEACQQLVRVRKGSTGTPWPCSPAHAGKETPVRGNPGVFHPPTA